MKKGGRTVETAAPALFSFMGSASSSVGPSALRWAFAPPRFGSRCFRIGQRKLIIRTHPLSEKGSDYMGLVREAGVEPARPCEHWHLKPASLPIPPLAQMGLALNARLIIPRAAAIVNSFFAPARNKIPPLPGRKTSGQ